MRYNQLSVMNLLEALRERVLVAEGAMGTRLLSTCLLSKGIAPDACLEALNLTNPSLIQRIHQEYREAGAEIFKSNTFGASMARLARHGVEAKCREINHAGVQLARSAAGRSGFVAGALGPLGDRVTLDSRREFRVQMDALVEAGADFLLLETFRELDELGEAIQAAREICDVPVVAQVSPDERGNLAGGVGPEVFIPQLAAWGVDVIGCNCGSGLDSMRETVLKIARLTDKPLSFQPSAGLPVSPQPFSQRGQSVYPCLPEELAQCASGLIPLGVRMIGGCCGTTPAHIRAIRESVSDTLGKSTRLAGPK